MSASINASWQTTPHLFDPISPKRRADPKYTGAGRSPCWEIFQTITYLENLNSTQKMVWRGHENDAWSLTTALQRYHDKVNPSVVLTAKTFRDEQNKVINAAHERGIALTEMGRWKSIILLQSYNITKFQRIYLM